MIYLNRKTMKKALSVDNVLNTVEEVYKLKSEGKTQVWPTVVHDFETGKKESDIKSGYIMGKEIHGLKAVNWIAGNEMNGFNPLNGIVVVFDSNTGIPIGMTEGSYVTGIRTGAAGAIGASCLANKNPERLLVVGTGAQAIYQTACFIRKFPSIREVYYYNRFHTEKAEFTCEFMGNVLRDDLGIETVDRVGFGVAYDLEAAVRQIDLIVTCTPSREAMIRKEWLLPGTHITCIGADMPGKRELESSIFADAKVFCDDKAHCIEAGEVEIPVSEGVIKPENIGEIGDVLTGKVQGRTSEDEITIFDAAGIALLDIATAKTALDYAAENRLGWRMTL